MSEFASYLPRLVVRIQVDMVVRVGVSATPPDDVDTGQDGRYEGTLHDSVHDSCCCGESYTCGICVV